MKTFKGFAIGLLAGVLLMVSVPSLAATIKQYTLVDITYPVMVNNAQYQSTELPVLNYDGNTYIPMRAVGDMLGASVNWNEAQKRAEIVYGSGQAAGNNAYRNVKVIGTGGNYTVTGEARVFEAVMSYAISDGHNYLLKKNEQVKEGAPAWSPFTLNVYIPQNELPVNGTLTIELFEYSAKDGSIVNLFQVPLEQFHS
ncbi:Gmad2 immunoglobulin-like domain-containing protein [Paenibacillus cymbidii]|uniref:Gmad2 immunoglobulin-like domain-containing protein n=1 Tax=Paenibacillus cymbidii TaxID=1639034 RepID=UPI0010817D6F|nr:Gmad2 immunoglobulin-like domain-containing protein [Paenibacillus cymbidii]